MGVGLGIGAVDGLGVHVTVDVHFIIEVVDFVPQLLNVLRIRFGHEFDSVLAVLSVEQSLSLPKKSLRVLQSGRLP
jgi:hypothetical protein